MTDSSFRSFSQVLVTGAVLAGALALGACRASDSDDTTSDAAVVSSGPALRVDGRPTAPIDVSVPGSDVAFSMVGVPGGALGGTEIAPFAIATLEVTWDQYMTMVAETEGPPPSKDGTKIDGLARPTKPYIATDRGFGMGTRPVISISALGAESFCDWLSLRTGKSFRLPTETEWEWAARAGSGGSYSAGVTAADLDQVAWMDGNANGTTHPVGQKSANAWGLFDMHGNVAEWTRAIEPGAHKWDRHRLCGGSFLDPAELLVVTERETRDSSWNMSDPQIPQSVWWLADAAWPGMRVVMELE